MNWTLDDGRFKLRWDERGGPPAREPTRKGFGSKLVSMGIGSSRRTALCYGDDGFCAAFEAERN